MFMHISITPYVRMSCALVQSLVMTMMITTLIILFGIMR